MKSIKLLFSLLVLLTCFTVVMAQSADCPVLVQTAMEKTLDVCSGAQRDQACYGNIALEATFQSGMTDQTFSEPGDVVMVDSLQTLKSIPADTTSELWGVALLRVLADLPDTLPGQAVTMIVFGGMEVGNAIPSHADSADQEMSAASDSVVRAAPSSDGQIVGAMVAGDSAVALGKTADNQWLRVELQDIDRRRGWVSASMMTGADMSTLTVLDPNDLPPSPMQAFYLKPSFRGLDCAQAPDGVLIQTPHVPDGIQLHVTVNDVQIALASTAYIQVETDGFLTVNLLEGHGQVEANDVTVDLPQGYRTRVPVSGDYSAIGSPSPIEAYDAGQMGYLPLGLLPEAITPTSDVWTEGESLCVNKVDGAWMRGTPSSLDQTVVLALVNGQAVAVNGEPQFDGIQSWLPVRTGNINGWVEQSSLTPCDQPVPPPCTPRSDWLYIYVVQSGDYLSKIANAAGISVTDLASGNCLDVSATLYAGTQLRVPRQPVFIVPTAAGNTVPPTAAPPDFSYLVSGNWSINISATDCNNQTTQQTGTYYVSVSSDLSNLTISQGGLSDQRTGSLLMTAYQGSSSISLSRVSSTSDQYTGVYSGYQIALDPYPTANGTAANMTARETSCSSQIG